MLEDKMKLIVTILVINAIDFISSLKQPSLQRTLLKAGLHRDLQTIYRIPRSLFKDPEIKCQGIIREFLPSSVYVDVFQLQSMGDHLGFEDKIIATQTNCYVGTFLVSFQKLKTIQYLSPTLDIEKAEYQSETFTFLMFTETFTEADSFVVNVTLPIHLRYHKPDIDFTNFYILPPDLLLRCENNEYTGEILRQEQLQCEPKDGLLCDWNFVIVKSDDDRLQVTVPVGNMKHSIVVVIGTLLVTFGGCTWIVFKVINTKLKQE